MSAQVFDMLTKQIVASAPKPPERPIPTLESVMRKAADAAHEFRSDEASEACWAIHCAAERLWKSRDVLRPALPACAANLTTQAVELNEMLEDVIGFYQKRESV